MLNKCIAWIFGKTQVSHFAKKSLIVNFRKSIDRQVKFINLSVYEEFSFKIDRVGPEASEYINNYRLIMSTLSPDGFAAEKILAYFESQKDAQNALVYLQNKMYNRYILNTLLTLLKVGVIAFVLFIVFSYIAYSLRVGSVQQQASLTTQQLQAAQLEQQRQLERLQAQAAQVNGSPQLVQRPQTANPPAAQPEPEVNFSAGSEAANGVLGALR